MFLSLFVSGFCILPPRLPGEGEGAAQDLPPGLTNGEHHAQKDELILISHGKLACPLLILILISFYSTVFII